MLQASQKVLASCSDRRVVAFHGQYTSRPVRTRSVAAQAASNQQPEVDRRTLLAGSVAVLLSQPGLAHAAKGAPKGFNAWEDLTDGYKFLYPFGWQEVAVNGADVVFKDIIEPLENVSMTLTTTEKQDITEFGSAQEVAETLANNVLTNGTQQVKVLSTSQRDLNGRNYYEFEFTANNGSYTRHQLAVVAAANGKFYTLSTGANERRWNKMKDRLQTTVRSFTLLY